MTIIQILKHHTEYSFESIEILFNEADDVFFNQKVNGFFIWQQFYHMINSMDRIFTDPVDYEYPAFHKDGMNMFEEKYFVNPGKQMIYDYYSAVKKSIIEYLNNLKEHDLYKISNHKTIKMTKADHILAQLRHMAWHIGYLHGCFKEVRGETPEHVLVRSINME